ncbi:Chaperone activity of bc1 complex-like protein [Echinococcus granulosus]|uniref:Chaperone activity of bc1 complex-like protein n=1 Tax=Echinococcus granulosus TaxID=6210 RepID=W6U8T6_ECHGR|nr:Chaperone activity of bc1 complex-like protein [Echinococcus granulosus]EUB56876.1 Chaperone activity of bc1 complex-like protein [Echinococcus granulosus]
MRSIFVSDCVKVLRGASCVLSAAIAIQANEIGTFLHLIGVRECLRGSGQLHPVAAGGVTKFRRPYNNCKCTTAPCFSFKTRNYSTFAPDAFEASPRNRSLSSSKERRVPVTRVDLFVGLGLGAAAEYAKRSIGASDKNDKSNVFLNDANLERIVDTLCRMRGAALKLGQMLSIQDSSLVSPKVQKIFERVRQSADFMPTSQMYEVVNAELGPNWREKLASFDEKPFAAASIGQVHLATLPDGRRLAMKVQYPGVAKSIETDVANITMILKRFNFMPRGLFAESAVRAAKKELKWECDYLREAYYAEKFARLLANDPVFLVPQVFHDFSTQKVFTTEYFEGLVIDDCASLSQDVRNWIGENLLRLCLLEVFVFNTMQTDPNWSNFLYNRDLNKIILLDFGASREYPRRFVDDYLRVIVAASNGDKPGILEYSRRLGFLTGYETKVFLDAHVEAVSVLGEAFASKVPFDFGKQSTTYRINRIIPVMLEHRLTPPPAETYSLHRKMSGCFLLCGRLGAVVDCRKLFLEVADSYVYGLGETPEVA